MKKILKRIKDFIGGFFPPTYYRFCYTDREYEGMAAMGCCHGLVGGTGATEYLSETCVSCPYLVLINERRNVNDNIKN